LAAVLALALIAASVLAPGAPSWLPFAASESHAASGSGIAAPYPWSKTAAATTGDYIADVYSGISKGGHVFEDVTVDRLADVLSAEGDYYVVFASPIKDTAQRVLATINEQAKAAGVTKIYHFNPVLDNKYLDITSADPSIASLGVSTTTNYANATNAPAGAATLEHRIGTIQTYINYFFPNDEAGDILRAYKSSNTLLFRFHKGSHTDLASEAAISATYQLKPADIVGGYSKAAQAAKIAGVFRDSEGAIVKGDVRTDYDFFERAYRGQLPGEDAISDANFTSGAGFNVKSLTFPAAFDLLNSPGEHAIFFGEVGCGNTKATLGWAAKRAKAYNRTIYFVDGSLGGSVRFKYGEDIDAQLAQTSNAWINIRLGQRTNGAVPSGYAGVGHLYGALFSYFGSGINTEDWSQSGRSVFYYENGINADTGTPTNRAYGTGASEAGPFDAPRFQYPFLLSYNKGFDQPVTVSTTAIQWGEQNGAPWLTEYMLGVSQVNAIHAYGWQLGDAVPVTIAGITNASTAKLHFDGLTDYDRILNPAYIKSVRQAQAADEGIEYDDGTGDNNNNNNDTVQSGAPKAFATAPAPSLVGEAVVGNTLGVKAGAWSDSPALSYQWYREGIAVAGATGSIYTLSKRDIGKLIQVAVKATKAGFQTTERISKVSASARAKGLFAGITSNSAKITGTAKVGKTLKAKVVGVSPRFTAKYRWYANGKAIKGATKASLKLKKSLKGKKITVTATLSRANYVKATVVSKAKRVKK
jgi:hypothetical protein